MWFVVRTKCYRQHSFSRKVRFVKPDFARKRLNACRWAIRCQFVVNRTAGAAMVRCVARGLYGGTRGGGSTYAVLLRRRVRAQSAGTVARIQRGGWGCDVQVRSLYFSLFFFLQLLFL